MQGVPRLATLNVHAGLAQKRNHFKSCRLPYRISRCNSQNSLRGRAGRQRLEYDRIIAKVACTDHRQFLQIDCSKVGAGQQDAAQGDNRIVISQRRRAP
jgi:hypothetical protein